VPEHLGGALDRWVNHMFPVYIVKKCKK
jgi:hypothetical protein